MNYCKLKITALLLLLSIYSNGQENFGNDNSPSGSGVSTAIKNNLFDGSATINIPFFNSNVDGIPINVSAVYSTKGIKVDQIASSIGLGWELAGIPYIQRIQKGKFDEMYVPGQAKYVFNPSTNHNDLVCSFGAIPYGAWLDKSNWTISDVETDAPGTLCPKENDDELDEFVLALGSNNIRFSIAKDGSLITFPQTDIKVERMIDGNAVLSTISVPPLSYANPTNSVGEIEFLVTDNAGNQYFFKKGDYEYLTIDDYYAYSTVSLPANCDPPLEVLKTTKWVIYKIISYNGSQFDFSYQKFSLHDELLGINQFLEEKTSSPNFTLKSKPRIFEGWVSVIKQIDLPDKKRVIFNYDPNNNRDDLPALANPYPTSSPAKALKEIVIQDITTGGDYKEMKYLFNYAYFNSNTVNYVTTPELPYPNTMYLPDPALALRLKLKSIQMYSNSQTKDYYSFEYENTRLPRRGAPGQDYYGYANGKTPVNNTGYTVPISIELSIPKHTPSVGQSWWEIGVDRNSDPNAAKGCVLTKVKNGFGGETEFTYYSTVPSLTDAITPPFNAYSSLSNSFDGLLLATRTDRDGFKEENSTVSIYQYFEGQRFLSSGVTSYSVKKDCNNLIINSDIFFNTAISSILPVNGSNHGFSKVMVMQKRNTTNAPTLNTTIYFFSNAIDIDATHNYNAAAGIPAINIFTSANLSAINNGQDFYKPHYYPPYTNKQYFRDWAIGLPTQTVLLDINGNEISRQTNTYIVNDQPLSSIPNRCSKYLEKKYDCNGVITEFYKDVYYPITGKAKLSSTTSNTSVSNTNAISNTVTYSYNSHDDISTITTSDSKGNPVVTKNYYNYDWSTNTAGAALNDLMQKDIHSLVLTEHWRTQNGTTLLVDVSAGGYNLVNGKVKQTRQYHFISGIGLTSSTYTSGPSSFNMQTASAGSPITNYKMMGSITSFNSIGEVQEVVSTDGTSSVKLYNSDKRQLLADVTNASLNEVAYTGFEASSSPQGTADENKGNWDYNGASIINLTNTYPYALAGRYAIKLAGNSSDKITSTITPTINKKYYLTFWVKDGVPVVKRANGSVIATQAIEFTKGGWMQYGVEFIGSGTAISLWATTTNAYVDELRLYPIGAQMTSYSYEPLCGVSSICDINNRFIFYEYDAFNRKKLVRNHWGEIINKTDYVQQGND